MQQYQHSEPEEVEMYCKTIALNNQTADNLTRAQGDETLTKSSNSEIFSCRRSTDTLSSSTTHEMCNLWIPYANGTNLAEKRNDH